VREPDGAGGVNELSIALIGILGPAVIAYAVYIYRPQIGFQTQCAKASFRAEDKKIVHSNFLNGVQIEIGKITLVNETRADVDEFEIAYELRDPNAQLTILETKNIAKSAISFTQDGEEISISIKRFPAKERVVIGYSIIGMWGLEYARPKKKSGKFNLYSIESRSEFFRYIFLGGFFGILIFLFPTLTIMAISRITGWQ
jgi:hypothetical protein